MNFRVHVRRGAAITLAALGTALLFWFFFLRPKSVPHRVLKIGFEVNPPYQTRLPDGSLGGMGVETLREAARRAGIQLEWVETGRSSVDSLRSGLADLWPLMADLPDRRQNIHFSHPYLIHSHAFLLPANMPEPSAGFSGVVAHFNLQINAQLIQQGFPKARRLEFQSSEDAVRAVCQDRADAAFVDSRTALEMLRNLSGCRPLRAAIIPSLTVPLCVASTFEAAGAADRLRREITGMFSDGTLIIIMAKNAYYGVDDVRATHDLIEAQLWQKWLALGIASLTAALLVAIWQGTSLYRVRRAAEQAQTQAEVSEQRFRSLVENLGTGILLMSAQGEIRFVNGALLKILGGREQPAPGSVIWNLPDWDSLREDLSPFPVAERPSARAVATGKPVHNVVMGVYSRDSRRLVWVLVSAVPLLTSDGAVDQVILSLLDITDRKCAEEELRRSEERFSKVFRSSPDSIVISTIRDGRYLEVNDGYLRMTGYTRSEVIHKTTHDTNFWAEPEERARCVTLLEQLGRIENEEIRFQTKTGAIRRGLLSAEPMELLGQPCWLTLVRDITDYKLLEEQFLQAQKMEAVGQLAGGIAHDFNNLLTIIQLYAEASLLKLSPTGQELPSGTLWSGLEEILKASRRATALTGQLLAFSRKQMVQPQVLSLNSVIVDLSRMLRRILGAKIELTFSMGKGLGNVRADPGQLQQVIMNLVINARDAMPEGGRLTIDATDVVLEAPSTLHAGVPTGRYVLLAASDTGIGMDKAVQARIFEPFFTTKEAGKGTGLGLATVYGIVKQAGGQILVDSEVGRGTTFRIYLPAVEESADRKESQALDELCSGTETVLVVEDEEGIRQIAVECLATAGFKVLSAASGKEALEMCRQKSAEIHLLLTDMMMPGMGGRELAERLKPLQARMKVLFMTGYNDDAALLHTIQASGTPFLQKPFRLVDLTRKVREALDARVEHIGV